MNSSSSVVVRPCDQEFPILFAVQPAIVQALAIAMQDASWIGYHLEVASLRPPGLCGQEPDVQVCALAAEQSFQ